jgi:uncharacterized tellurite resistance protein B-like protein
MSIASLSNIKKFFSNTESPDQKQALYKEMLLMTLSRATRADLVTDDTEVKTVQRILCEILEEDVSSADIRTAASSELFEQVPLKKYLERMGPQLDAGQNCAIIKGLIDIFRADGNVTESEIEFFNMVANALKISPAELVGLVSP